GCRLGGSGMVLPGAGLTATRWQHRWRSGGTAGVLVERAPMAARLEEQQLVGRRWVLCDLLEGVVSKRGRRRAGTARGHFCHQAPALQPPALSQRANEAVVSRRPSAVRHRLGLRAWGANDGRRSTGGGGRADCG